jgi:hypothetical protein
VVPTAQAYELYEKKVDVPYTIVELENDVEFSQVYLGELANFPIMYGFKIEEPAEFKFSLRQKYSSSEEVLPFGLILVKEEDKRGVTEILRFNPKMDEWVVKKEKTIGLNFLDSDAVTSTLEPGTYRLEVSTPVNLGKYMLSIGLGDDNSSGYFKSLSQTRTIQSFYGHSIFKMLSSSMVYYPLGIIFLLLLILITWKYRKSITPNA